MARRLLANMAGNHSCRVRLSSAFCTRITDLPHRSHDRAFLCVSMPPCRHSAKSYRPPSATPSQQISSTSIPSVLTTTRGTCALSIAGSFAYVVGTSLTSRTSSLTFNPFSNFTQFYSTKSERDRNLKKEYEAQMEYRRHLQAFIDRWRYNANRGL